ncbi:MAG: sugar kinase [Chloroflexi bacterium]|nr:sugar kinase [Chloroflexota bacterium]
MQAGPEVIALGEALVEIMRPERDSPLDAAGSFEGPFPSGAPAIFASAAARLGLQTGFIGAVGDDAFGRLFNTRLNGDGVDLTHLHVDTEHATGVAFVAYRHDGSREFVYHLRHSAAGQAPPLLPSYFANARWIHITGSTLASGPAWQSTCEQAARLGKAAGSYVSFDPNIRPELLRAASVTELCGGILSVADVVLPSGEELTMLTGRQGAGAAQALFDKGVRMVVLKQGAEGSTLYTHEDELHMASRPREERDPTGAGDAFAAAIAYGVLRGLTHHQMLRLANSVGALAVTKLGPMEGIPFLATALQDAEDDE